MVKQSSPYKHLLIIRLSALGDVAMVPHAVRALRVSYPELKISIFSKAELEPLFADLNVNFIAADMSMLRGAVAGYWRLAREFRAMGVDAVADLHDVLYTKRIRCFVRLSGIAVKHICKGYFSKWLRINGGCGEVSKPLKHTVVRYCDVIRRLGFQFDDPTPPTTKVPRPIPMPYEKGAAERWIGVAPFSANKGKIYPLPLMSQVIEELAKRYDRVFVHSGPGDELAFAQEFEDRLPNVEAVFSKMKIAGEIDLIANEDCLVTMDSFAMHVASLVVTPTVSVWGATHPSLGYSGYGTSSESYVQIEGLRCRPCSTYGKKPCRLKDYRCLHDITPSQIVDRVAKTLEK